MLIRIKLNSKWQMFSIKLTLHILTKRYYQFDMTKPQLDLRTLNNVKFWPLSYRFQTSIKLKLNSKLKMFPIKLILGILTDRYYQFDMTKPKLDLRTSNDVKFWLLSYRFRMSIKLKLNSKLQMFPIKLILGIWRNCSNNLLNTAIWCFVWFLPEICHSLILCLQFSCNRFMGGASQSHESDVEFQDEPHPWISLILCQMIPPTGVSLQ